MATLELLNVKKQFGSVTAVENFSLFVNDGEFVTLLGPSGCGKTTLLNIIAGLEEMTSGEVRMNQRVVNRLSPFERNVAMVFQNYALYPHMTVAENIGFSLKLRKRPRQEIMERVAQVARMLELEQLLDRLPRELSGGQQQRVAIGRAVIRQPDIFLFDEPFSNLDAALRIKTRGEVKLLHQKLGVTSIFVTHDQEEALSLSDKIAVMRQGRLEQFGTPEEIYSKPASKYVARFIGSPQIDIFEGQFKYENNRYVYRIGSIALNLPHTITIPDKPVDMGIRSEYVKIGEAGFPATVHLVQPIGPFTYITVNWEGGSATARVNGISHIKPGEVVQVEFASEALLFFDRESEKRMDLW
jgi:ABC-type sugar transport system ATPase subunit